MNAFRKTVAAGLAALTLAGATLAATPASAHHHHGGGFVGALFGGLVLGAIAAEAASHDYDCGYVRQPVTDDYGYVVGYHRVRVCN